jgi:hypothetical protein
VTGRPTTSSGPRPAARRLCRAAVSAATMAHAASLVQGSVSSSRMRPRYAASWVPATRRRPSQLGRSARRCPRPRGSWRPRRVEYPGGILGGILGGEAQALQRSCRGLAGVVGRGQGNALGGVSTARCGTVVMGLVLPLAGWVPDPRQPDAREPDAREPNTKRVDGGVSWCNLMPETTRIEKSRWRGPGGDGRRYD